MIHHSLVTLGVLGGLAGSEVDGTDLDRFGGWKAIYLGGTGFFRTHHDGRRWWLVTPEGHAFLSIGVCSVHPFGDAIRGTGHRPYHANVLAKHGSVQNWARSTRDRLVRWGFNTLACWSSGDVQNMPRTVGLSFSSGVGGDWLRGGMPDYFSPAFIENAAKVATECGDRRDDPWLIGYFLDNELAWDRDWRPVPNLFDRYTALPETAPGKQALCRFLEERYKTCEALGRVWTPHVSQWKDLLGVRQLTARPDQADVARSDREAFVLHAARQYFRTCVQAIRKVDPNHLILGSRFVSWVVPRAVVQACGDYCDVVSINFYELGLIGSMYYQARQPTSDWLPGQPDFEPFFARAGKPLLISEFGFRSMDSGLPNTYPPPLAVQPTVPTQRVRAERYAKYVEGWMRRPFVVGYHWFEWADEPKEGRFDGENGNYGLVNIRDEPYDGFVQAVTRVNRRVWTLHRGD